jgi:glutathione peroxidase
MRRCLFSLILLATCAMPAAAACPALLDRSMTDIQEQSRSLCEFAGKVVLVVNTASQCGYTPQYEGLEALYRKYRGRGLVVLGFPSNDFGAQEPGSNREIAAFCTNQYSIEFPMFGKSSVRGAQANPLFADLAKSTGQEPRWNFHKYLLARDGKQVLSFNTRVAPGDPKLLAAIETLLSVR